MRRANVTRWLLLSCAMVLAAVSLGHPLAEAEEVDPPTPITLQVVGKTLRLNGHGLRTYSILGIHIYAASLYLEHLSSNPDAIIQSPETKLLTVRFEHDVSSDQARDSWKTALENNCLAP